MFACEIVSINTLRVVLYPYLELEVSNHFRVRCLF